MSVNRFLVYEIIIDWYWCNVILLVLVIFLNEEEEKVMVVDELLVEEKLDDCYELEVGSKFYLEYYV